MLYNDWYEGYINANKSFELHNNNWLTLNMERFVSILAWIEEAETSHFSVDK